MCGQHPGKMSRVEVGGSFLCLSSDFFFAFLFNSYSRYSIVLRCSAGVNLYELVTGMSDLTAVQLKLGLDYTLIFCRFGFSRFGLVELVRLI